MKNSNAKYALRVTVGIILAVITAVCLVGTMTMVKYIFVSWLIPVGIGFGIAAISGLTMQRMWRWLTGKQGFLLNYLCHVLFFTSIISMGLLICNYCLPTQKEVRHEKCVITRVYREKHYRTKRINRRVYTRGEPYYLYMANIQLADGRDIPVDIGFDRYRYLHKGDSVRVSLCKGFFGWDELMADSIVYPRKRKKKKTRPYTLRYMSTHRPHVSTRSDGSDNSVEGRDVRDNNP